MKNININIYSVLVITFFLWVLLEGILRKWILTSLATPIFFVKYIIVIFIAAVFILNKEKIQKRFYPFIGYYLFFFSFCILEIINLSVTDSFFLPLIGFVIYLGFSILIFTIPKVVKNKHDLIKAIHYLEYLCIPIFIIGIIQYFSPIDSFINKYIGDDSYIATVGTHARVTTVFSYIGTNTAFTNFTLLLIFFRAVVVSKTPTQKIVSFAILLLGFTIAFMTGSRSLVFITLIQFIILIILSPSYITTDAVYGLLVRTLLLGLVFVAFIKFNDNGQTVFNAFVDRVEKNNDIEGRVIDSFDPFKYLKQSGMIGLGLGSTYQGGKQFINKAYLLPDKFEEESERIVIEIGFIGFIIYFLLRASIFIYSLSVFLKIDNTYLKGLTACLIVHQSPALLFFNQATFNWMENILYWTGTGLIVSIYQISVNEKRYQDLSLTSW